MIYTPPVRGYLHQNGKVPLAYWHYSRRTAYKEVSEKYIRWEHCLVQTGCHQLSQTHYRLAVRPQQSTKAINPGPEACTRTRLPSILSLEKVTLWHALLLAGSMFVNQDQYPLDLPTIIYQTRILLKGHMRLFLCMQLARDKHRSTTHQGSASAP